VTRFDALEKPWGHWAPGLAWRNDGGTPRFDVTNRLADAAGTDARTQENIEFERAYIDFTTKIGRFNVGYQNFVAWGTMFLDTHVTRPGIKYFVPVGPLTVVAAIEKTADKNVGNGITAAADANIYDLGFIFKFGAGEAGLMYQYGDNNINRNAIPGVAEFSTKLHIFNPYVKAKVGPVYVEAEGVYGTGKIVDSELPTLPSVDGEAMGLYIHAKGDVGPLYVGGIFAWMRGDDPATTNKVEGTLAAALLAGQAWDPCLILWNDGIYGGQHRLTTPVGVFFDNAWFYQVYGGFKPTKQADIMMSLTTAYADKKPTVTWLNDNYGTELDLIAKYKLFDNLEYMVGAAYLWTGDFFKGSVATTPIDNNFMLFHKLTLAF
jgi:hypothetical protein